MKQLGRFAFVLLVCLVIPFGALAITEGAVEEAPMVDVSLDMGKDELSYLPDVSYYANDYGYEPKWGASETYVEPEFDGECFYPSMQSPNLSTGERTRAKRLLNDYQKGKATGNGANVLNVQEDVTLGVYPLDPADYDGESVFVILPNICLTDAQILDMIDAFDQLGLTFDPDALTYRNCMRGGGIECTRFFTDEEQGRRSTLRNLIRRGKLTFPNESAQGRQSRQGQGQQGEQRLSRRQRSRLGDQTCLSVSLDARYFNGLNDFTFMPYRRMTDEELAAQLVDMGVRDESEEIEFDDLEKATRELLTQAFDCPLSMELDSIGQDGSYVPCTFDEDGLAMYADEGRAAYQVTYRYPKDGFETVIATISLDAETKRVVCMDVTDIPIGWIQNETMRDPAVPDASYIEAADAFVQTYMWDFADQPDEIVWRVMDGEVWTNYGGSVCVAGRIEQTGDMLILIVGCGDMQVHNAQIHADQKDWFEGVEFKSISDMPINE